jgi:hypothetical protein
MKVLMLVISSPSLNPVYATLKDVWTSYMNTNTAIDSFFIEYHPEKNMAIEGNTIYIKGRESDHPGCREKTIDALDFFLNGDNKYDFIIRTNISSLWNFTALLKYLDTLPKTNVYAGIIGQHKSQRFVSGAGFIMSPDVARRVVDNRAMMNRSNIIDDVDIGFVLGHLNVPFTAGNRYDIYSMNMFNSYVFDNSVYHYRIKWNNTAMRHEEPIVMKKLLDKMLN